MTHTACAAHWFPDLCTLVSRFACLGISEDIRSMSSAELQGLYFHLRRLDPERVDG